MWYNATREVAFSEKTVPSKRQRRGWGGREWTRATSADHHDNLPKEAEAMRLEVNLSRVPG